MCRVGLYHVPPLDLLDVAGTVTRGNTWGKTFIKESSCLGVGACSMDGDGFSCWSVEEQGEWRRLGEMIIKIKVLIPGGGGPQSETWIAGQHQLLHGDPSSAVSVLRSNAPPPT